MRYILTAILIITGTLATMAQEKVISLYQETPPGNKDVQVQEEWTKSGSGSAVVTKVTNPELWYYPAAKENTAPAIIICPGGGYAYQAYEHEGKKVAQWLSSIGYQAFVLKYRLPDEALFEDATYIPLADARKAISLIKKKASSLGVNSEKVGIMGFSAGGHLAASASTLFNHQFTHCLSGESVRPDFSILLYPVISMTDSLTHKGSRTALLGKNPSEDLIELFSPELQVSSQTPPTFVLHAMDDGGVPPGNTIQYAKALRARDIPVKEILLPKGGHGFGFRPESPAFEWTEHLQKWLENL